MLKHRPLRSTLVALAAVTAFLVIGAGSAAASVHWSDTTHGIKATGTVKVVESGKEKSCTAKTPQESSMSAHGALIWNSGSTLNFKCETSGTLGMWFNMNATSVTSVTVGLSLEATWPWSPEEILFYRETPATADFANGTSEAVPSTLTFANDLIGNSPSNKQMYLTGKLSITTSEGKLLTLQP